MFQCLKYLCIRKHVIEMKGAAMTIKIEEYLLGLLYINVSPERRSNPIPPVINRAARPHLLQCSVGVLACTTKCFNSSRMLPPGQSGHLSNKVYPKYTLDFSFGQKETLCYSFIDLPINGFRAVSQTESSVSGLYKCSI